jgi:endosialidase-like protein
MALGQGALANNLTGSGNTAMGFQALNVNRTDDNVAVGFQALRSNTIGNVNTAIGFQALLSNTDGSFNTAVGNGALAFNISGQENTVVGFAALGNHAPGNFNTAVGSIALLNTTGIENTGVGAHVLDNNTSGNLNTAVGFGALVASHGSNNIALGVNAGLNVTTADGVIAIGSLGGNTSNTCWIGNIFGKTTVSATTMPVLVSNTGQLGTAASSRRFKHDIKPMDKISDAILALKPVTFHYKSDSTKTAQFGLIAEEVAEVNPDLVVRDDKGEIYSVRYDAVNAMLLSEFLK